MTANEEWIKVNELIDISQYIELKFNTTLPFMNSDDFLKNSSPPQWVLRATGEYS